MSLNSGQIQILADELNDDPLNLGWAAMDDAAASTAINLKDKWVDQDSVESEQIRTAVGYEAFARLQADAREWLVWMTSPSSIQITRPVKITLCGYGFCIDGAEGFGDNSDSFWQPQDQDTEAPALKALIERLVTRANMIGLPRVSQGEIEAARAM